MKLWTGQVKTGKKTEDKMMTKKKNCLFGEHNVKDMRKEGKGDVAKMI